MSGNQNHSAMCDMCQDHKTGGLQLWFLESTSATPRDSNEELKVAMDQLGLETKDMSDFTTLMEVSDGVGQSIMCMENQECWYLVV